MTNREKMLTNNHNGIGWEEGNISLEELCTTLTSVINGKTIYLKNSEKIRWFRQLMLDYPMQLVLENLRDLRCHILLSGNKPATEQKKTKRSSSFSSINDTIDIISATIIVKKRKFNKKIKTK